MDVHYTNPIPTMDEWQQVTAPFADKLLWFLERGYKPHRFQHAFHFMPDSSGTNLLRNRHITAGRRGGKTMSAAWEVAFYATNPAAYWMHAKGIESDEPLWIWVVTKNHKIGRIPLRAFRQTLRKAGLVKDVDYKENKSELTFEFNDSTVVEFRSADDPDSLRGPGLNLLWIDEAAMIPDDRPWDIISPALADQKGHLITTTTPAGKNWYYDAFFAADRKTDEWQGRVEFRSIDNPYFDEDEWKRYKKVYHPLRFKQEFEASFDAMHGKDLNGDWLQYYTHDELPSLDKMTLYIGVDPAISSSSTADRFVITLLGVMKDNSQAYLLKQEALKIPFAEQVDIIAQWYYKYRPQLIGIEATAYQAALAQQVQRLAGMPPVVPMFAKGKKFERILSMSNVFRIGKVLINDMHRDFIDEWINYDAELRAPKDDCLDSMEIALRTAGVLLEIEAETWEELDMPARDIEELAHRMQQGNPWAEKVGHYDPELGQDW